MFERTIIKKIKALQKQYKVILLTGPRQSGKSTLLKYIFPNYRYINFEQLNISQAAKSDPVGFLEEYDKYIIFDEVQRVPELLSYIQVLIDKHDVKGQFILSGSQNLLLMQSVSQSLAGRVAILNLLPFSLEEYRTIDSDLKLTPEEWIFNGCYPGLYKDKLNPNDYYANYITTYIERDLRQIQNIKDLFQFKNFMTVLAGRIGSIIDYTDISNIIGISLPTVKRWLSTLEVCYVIYTLPPYYKNYDKRIIKSPKLFFYDTGVACNLLNIKNANDLKGHFMFGHLFENMVINDQIKKILHKGQKNNFYYWRNSNAKEVDLIIPDGATLKTIEIKASKTLNIDFQKTLNDFEALSKDMVKKYVYYAGDEKLKTSKNVNFVPWSEHHKDV